MGLLIRSFLLGLLLIGCAAEADSELRLLIVPHHRGRGLEQDPFQNVDRLEVGLTESNGSYTALGGDTPQVQLAFDHAPDRRTGSPTLVGFSGSGQELSVGYGEQVVLERGLDATVSVPFVYSDYAVARHISLDPRKVAGIADPFAGRPPAFRLDKNNLTQGQLSSDADAGCLVWLLWRGETLFVRVLVQDDQLNPGLEGQLTDGDALQLLVDRRGDGTNLESAILSAAGDIDGSLLENVHVENIPGGWISTFEIPLLWARKNLAFRFNLELIDRDPLESSVTRLTWVSVPASKSLGDRTGFVILGVELLDLLDVDMATGSGVRFAGPDGEITLSGSWSPRALSLSVGVVDDEVVPGPGEADRLEVWLDLANDKLPVENFHFARLRLNAGNEVDLAVGAEPASLSSATFSGEAHCGSRPGGYACSIAIPWADLKLVPQRGWFLGFDLVVTDVDQESVLDVRWSDEAGPDRWSEIRLFSLE